MKRKVARAGITVTYWLLSPATIAVGHKPTPARPPAPRPAASDPNARNGWKSVVGSATDTRQRVSMVQTDTRQTP